MYAPGAQLDSLARLVSLRPCPSDHAARARVRLEILIFDGSCSQGIFWELYSRGKETMMKLLPVSAALLAYAAYATETPANYLPATFVAGHRKASPTLAQSRMRSADVAPRSVRQAILGTAACLAVSTVPWTYIFIMPINMKLKAIKDAKASGKATAEGTWPALCLLGARPPNVPSREYSITANTSDAEIDDLIRTRWMGLHYARIALTGAAFALSVAELGTA